MDEPTSPAERWVILAEACAGIFAERGCRDGWLAAAKADPSARVGVMAEGCRAAYCPLLAPPKPELCDPRFASGLSPSSFRALWPDFFAAVLERDLGADRRVVGDAMKALVVPLMPVVIEVPASPLPDGGPPPVTVHLRCPKACELELDGPDGKQLGHWSVSPGGGGPGMSQMARRAAGAAKGRAVTIQAAAEVPFKVVVAVMDALRDEGLEDVSFSVDRRGDGG